MAKTEHRYIYSKICIILYVRIFFKEIKTFNTRHLYNSAGNKMYIEVVHLLINAFVFASDIYFEFQF